MNVENMYGEHEENIAIKAVMGQYLENWLCGSYRTRSLFRIR